MKLLSRNQMKNLKGGKAFLQLTGTTLSNGKCYCDFYGQSAIEGSQPYTLCNQPCNISMCSRPLGTIS